jgi:hypothetical protein
LLVLDILKSEKSRVRDRFISYSKYSKYSRRGTLFIQIQVGSALTETENWDRLGDCTSRDGHERGFFLILIYQEQAIGLSFKKQWCIWR